MFPAWVRAGIADEGIGLDAACIAPGTPAIRVRVVSPTAGALQIPPVFASMNRVRDGMLAGGFGLLGALLARQRHGGCLLAAVAAGLAVKALVDLDPIADTVHPTCLGLGAATALLTDWRREPQPAG